jgi:hypothetical protein
VTHSTCTAPQLDELSAAADKTWDICIAMSESWDTASETENTGSGTTDVELASVHNSGMGH